MTTKTTEKPLLPGIKNRSRSGIKVTREKKLNLPKYCYARGKKAWVRFKNEDGKWINKATPYFVEQTELLRRFVNALIRGVESKVARGSAAPNTVADYAKKWCDERDKRGVDCAATDRQRLNDYVLPHIGEVSLDELRPRHIRDMVLALRALSGDDRLAPRTIHHIFNLVHSMFESAMTDELVWGENPVKVKPGTLPKKVDSDPEWRSQATFYTKEVLMLISEPIIPVARRVQYALKALTGMRHGEVAALCWRHIDEFAEPLWKINVVQAWSTPKKKIKSTKTEETRAVPMHPTLRVILTAWRDTHWPRIHGRAPGPDDLVVPSHTMKCVDGGDAVEAFERDLNALGLRTKAGSERNRNGHDLRAWYETQCVEDGADSALIWRTTHAPPKTVEAGYKRYSWAAYCREVAKLSVVLDGEPLRVVTTSLQAESKASGRWRKTVTPLGLEPDRSEQVERFRTSVLDERESRVRAARERTRTLQRNEFVTPAATLANMLERAARDGDMPRVLEIAAQLRAK